MGKREIMNQLALRMMSLDRTLSRVQVIEKINEYFKDCNTTHKMVDLIRANGGSEEIAKSLVAASVSKAA